VGVPRGVAGYLLVVYQVGPVPFRHGVLGIGNQECARLAELVGVPADFVCALSQERVWGWRPVTLYRAPGTGRDRCLNLRRSHDV
jgi:hypothetical protein